MLLYDTYQHPNLTRRWKVMGVVVRDVLAKNQVA